MSSLPEIKDRRVPPQFTIQSSYTLSSSLAFPYKASYNFRARYTFERLWSTNSPHSTYRIIITQTARVVCPAPCTGKCRDNDRNWVPCVSFSLQFQGLLTSILSIHFPCPWHIYKHPCHYLILSLQPRPLSSLI